MIDIRGVTRRFGSAVAVDHVTLDIGAGDSVALWGANGAGKTTLIRCVLGLLRFEGSVCVAGRDVWRHGKAARLMIGYVPQELGFYDELGVGEAVRFFARLKGLHRIDASVALESVGLSGQGRKRIRELSGGMKQRLALALALLGDPSILVLDEVTASLDAVGRRELVHLLERLSGEGRTMLFASHRIDEVAALAKRVVVLDRGRLAGVSTVAEFVARHAEESAGGALLHLTIPATVRIHAIDTLQRGGFPARLHGCSVVVPVSPERKAVPFHVLADARIPVEDFELVGLDGIAARKEQKP